MSAIHASADRAFFQPAETLRTAMAGLEFAQLLAHHFGYQRGVAL